MKTPAHKTTLVVQVTLKVNVEGDSSGALISEALDKVSSHPALGIKYPDGITFEGAQVLVDHKALSRACDEVTA